MNDTERDELLAACDYLVESFGDIKERITRSPDYGAVLAGEADIEDVDDVSVSDYPDMERYYRNVSRSRGSGDLPSLSDSIRSTKSCDDLIDAVEKARANFLVKAQPTTQVAPANIVDDEQTNTVMVEAAPAEPVAPEPKAATVASSMEPEAAVTKDPEPPKKKLSPRELKQRMLEYLEKVLQQVSNRETVLNYPKGFTEAYNVITDGKSCPPANSLTPKQVGDMLTNVKKYVPPDDIVASPTPSNTSAATNKGESGTPRSPVENSVSYRFYRTGEYGSYTPLFLGDLLASEQFKIMGCKRQLVLLDMIDTCNRLYATIRSETEGFTFTYSQCRVEMSEAWFRKCTEELVQRGWFQVVESKPMFRYFPCEAWKTKPLTGPETQELIDRDKGKAERISQKKDRAAQREEEG